MKNAIVLEGKEHGRKRNRIEVRSSLQGKSVDQKLDEKYGSAIVLGLKIGGERI